MLTVQEIATWGWSSTVSASYKVKSNGSSLKFHAGKFSLEIGTRIDYQKNPFEINLIVSPWFKHEHNIRGQQIYSICSLGEVLDNSRVNSKLKQNLLYHLDIFGREKYQEIP